MAAEVPPRGRGLLKGADLSVRMRELLVATANRWFWFLSTIAGVLAVVANFVHLSTLSMRYDEPVYMHAGWRYVNGDVMTPKHLMNGSLRVAFVDNFEHPPLAKYLFGTAQLTVGRLSLTADRTVAATCTVATGLLLFWWLARVASRWAGLLAGMLVTLLPQHGVVPDSFSRHGLLEPVAAMFVVASLALSWLWFCSAHRRAWLFAMATGGVLGLAASAKETGFLGLLGPVVLGVALVARDRRAAVVRGAQAVAAAGSSIAVFLALYLPIGSPRTIVGYMFDYQGLHLNAPHKTVVAGQIYEFPPWWANFWFAYHALGALTTVALVSLALSALLLRRDRLTGWLLAALTGPVLFHCFMSNVALSFYWTLWAPVFYALSALGALALADAARAAHGTQSVISGIGAAAALAVFCMSFGSMVTGVLALRPSGMRMVPVAMRGADLRGPVIVIGLPVGTLREYLPSKLLRENLPASLAGIDTVVFSTSDCRRTDPVTSTFVHTNVHDGALEPVYADAELTVFKVVSTLHLPTSVPASPPPSSVSPCR